MAKVSRSLSCGRYEVKMLSIREINDMRNAGKLDSSAAYQRALKLAWLKLDFRGAVADSILSGLSLGAIYAVERADGTWELLDGKQRVNFIAQTLDGLLGFGEIASFPELSGRDFLDWPEGDRNKFLGYQIPFFVFRDLDDEGRALQFARLNGAGVKLTKMESLRGSVVTVLALPEVVKAIDTVMRLLPSSEARPVSRDTAVEVVLQALSYVSVANTSFLGGDVIAALKDADMSAVKTAAGVVLGRALALSEVKRDDADNEVSFCWRKSGLSTALCVDGLGFDRLVKFQYSRSLHLAKGEDQSRWSELVGSGSASSSSVTERIEILGRVARGSATANTVKPPSDAPSKTPVAGVKPSELERFTREARESWGDSFAGLMDRIPAIFGAVSKVGEDIKAYASKSGPAVRYLPLRGGSPRDSLVSDILIKMVGVK